MKFTAINHVALVTGNLDLTIRFWRDLLGARVLITMGRNSYKTYFFEISPHSMVGFFEWPQVTPGPEKDHGVPVQGPVVFDHVCINVEKADDLWELKAKLEAGGFWASEVVDHGFIWSLYSFDPNNIPLEFSFPISGKDPHRCTVVADKHPTRIALEGESPQTTAWPHPQEPIAESDKVVYPGSDMELFDRGD